MTEPGRRTTLQQAARGTAFVVAIGASVAVVVFVIAWLLVTVMA